jgi:hypothetical protein
VPTHDGLERKSLSSPLRYKQTSQGGEAGQVEAIFSTLNVVDHDNDVTLPGAFTQGQAVKMAWAHDWENFWPGKGVIEEQPGQAVFRGEFFLNTWHGKEAYETAKAMGDALEWSYGFRVDDSEPGEFQGRQVRFLKRVTVFEVSPVLLGAGVGTRTLALKSAGAAAPVTREELRRIRMQFERWRFDATIRRNERSKQASALATAPPRTLPFELVRYWRVPEHDLDPQWVATVQDAVKRARDASGHAWSRPFRVQFATARPRYGTELEGPEHASAWYERADGVHQITIRADIYQDATLPALDRIAGHEVAHAGQAERYGRCYPSAVKERDADAEGERNADYWARRRAQKGLSG